MLILGQPHPRHSSGCTRTDRKSLPRGGMSRVCDPPTEATVSDCLAVCWGKGDAMGETAAGLPPRFTRAQTHVSTQRCHRAPRPRLGAVAVTPTCGPDQRLLCTLQVVVTLGTTSCCSFDCLPELGPVCEYWAHSLLTLFSPEGWRPSSGLSPLTSPHCYDKYDRILNVT